MHALVRTMSSNSLFDVGGVRASSISKAGMTRAMWGCKCCCRLVSIVWRSEEESTRHTRKESCVCVCVCVCVYVYVFIYIYIYMCVCDRGQDATSLAGPGAKSASI
jgi:hypothetical protein